MLNNQVKQLTDDFEVTLRPFDARWEAIVTCYGFEEGHKAGSLREVDPSPTEALRKALARAGFYAV